MSTNDDAQHYRIRVGGHLGSRWSAWFDGLDLTNEADGTSVLCGPIADQAALHGLLQRLRDLGIPLLSLSRLPASVHAPDTENVTHTHTHAPGAKP